LRGCRLDHARREGDDFGGAAYGARLAYLLAVAADHEVDIDAGHPDRRSGDDRPMPPAVQP
jgi:hypothetical protein